MSKKQLLCLLGVWVMIFPLFGVPTLWIRIIAVVTGLVVIALAYSFPSEVPRGNQETYVENKQP